MESNTDISHLIAQLDSGDPKPCESIYGCDFEATTMMWCDHTRLGCDYTGYRCDIHRNLMILETVRCIDLMKRNPEKVFICVECRQRITAGSLTDHLRWVRI